MCPACGESARRGRRAAPHQYGDLENLLAHAARCSRNVPREALARTPAEHALSKRLVTIMTDVPVELDLAALEACIPDKQALARVFNELEFHSLMARVDRLEGVGGSILTPPSESFPAGDDTVTTAGPPLPDLDVTIVTDPAGLAPPADELRAAPCAVDNRDLVAGPHDAELIGLSFAVTRPGSWYLPFGHRAPRAISSIMARVRHSMVRAAGVTFHHRRPALCADPRVLEDASIRRAGHNLKYDSRCCGRAGVEVAGLGWDSMLASFVLDPSRRSHGIDALSIEFLGQSMTLYTDLAGRGKTQIPFAEVRVDKAAAYCGADSATVLALHEHFAPELERTELLPLLRTIEMPLIPVLADMEWAGIAIDPAHFSRLDRELSHDLGVLELEIQRAAGDRPLNINSPRQLAAILFEEQRLPVLKKTKTGPSTDAEVLEQLAEMGHALPRLILGYRELQKLKSTYVDVLPTRVNRTTGRIHTSFNQVGADGAPLVERPEPPEHPVAHPPARRSARLRAGARLDVHRRRLFADRAAPDGALVGGPGVH